MCSCGRAVWREFALRASLALAVVLSVVVRLSAALWRCALFVLDAAYSLLARFDSAAGVRSQTVRARPHRQRQPYAGVRPNRGVCVMLRVMQR